MTHNAVIIYKNVLPENLSLDYLSENIEDLFSDDALAKLQSVISDYLQSIVDIEGRLQVDFSEESKKAYLNIKSTNYKYMDASSETKPPYDENDLNVLKDKIPARIYELALLQNKEWQSLAKKLFKSSEVRTRIGQLSLEIDETKSEIDTHVREWYRINYYENPMFESISSRNSGKLEYSLGAKEYLCDFMLYGVWPREEEIESLNICLRLNKNEAERSVIQAEQIKERFTRIYTGVLEDKKKKQNNVEKELTKLVGNWKNPIILSIIDGVKDTTKLSEVACTEGLVAEEVGEYSAKELVSELVNHNDEVLEVEEDKKK